MGEIISGDEETPEETPATEEDEQNPGEGGDQSGDNQDEDQASSEEQPAVEDGSEDVQEPVEEEAAEELVDADDSEEDVPAVREANHTITIEAFFDDGEEAVDKYTDYAEVSNVTGADKEDDGTYKTQDSNVSFEVEPATGDDKDYEIELVKYAVGSEDAEELTKDGETGSYTIKGDEITGNITISIYVVTKTYIVKAPADGTEAGAGVTWQAAKQGDSNAADEVNGLKKTDTVTFTATLAAGTAKSVKVNLDGDLETEVQTLTATGDKAGTATFNVSVAKLIEKLEADGTGDFYQPTATYTADGETPEVEEATVTITGADDAVLGEDFTAEYRVAGDAEAEFALVTADGITEKIGTKIELRFKALPDENGERTIDEVTFNGETESLTPTGNIYTIEIQEVDEKDTKNNLVEVKLAAANVITITKEAGAEVEKVEYTTDQDVTDKSKWIEADSDGDGWKIATKETSVTLRVTAKNFNKVTFVHAGDEAHVTDVDCDYDIFDEEPSQTVTTSTITFDEETTSVPVLIGTEHITAQYTLKGVAGITASVVDKDGKEAEKVTKTEPSTPGDGDDGEEENPSTGGGTPGGGDDTGTDALADGDTEAGDDTDGDDTTGDDTTGDDTAPVDVIYELNAGETYYVKISEEDLAKVDTVKIDEAALKDYIDSLGLEFEAGEENAVIVITLAGEATFDVMVEMSDEADGAATVKAEDYKTADGETQKGDEEPQAISGTISYAGVLKGEDFSFTVAVSGDAYEIVDVSAVDENDSAVTLEEGDAEGSYTIKGISADVTIKVTTALKEDQRYTVTFEASEDVKSVSRVVGEDEQVIGDLSKPVYIKKADKASISIKVEPKAGYQIDKVVFGETEKEASNGAFTYEFAADDTEVTVKINPEAIALSASQYVRFILPEDESVSLNILTQEVKEVLDDDGKGTGIYELPKAQAASDDQEAVEEVPELRFELSVSVGKWLSNKDFLNDVAKKNPVRTVEERKKSGDNWIYTYKAVANLLGSTKEVPYEITVEAAEDETVSFVLDEGSKDVNYKEGTRFWSLDSYGLTGTPGTTYIFQAEKGQNVTVDGNPVELDDFQKFSVKAELKDDQEGVSETVINVQEAEEYKAWYRVDGGASYAPAGEEAIEVAKVGDKVYVKLTNEDDEDVAVSSAKAKETDIASTVKVEEGEAVIEVKDASISVDLYTIVEDTLANGFIKKTSKMVATVSFTSKDASGRKLTAKGITAGKTYKLDGASKTTYALTLKEGKTVLDVQKYADAKAIVATSDNANVKVDIVNGNLVVNTLQAEKAVITITDQKAGELLKFNVDGQTPALKVKTLASSNQGVQDVIIDITPDKSVKPVADGAHLYYEVIVGAVDSGKVYYLPATDEDGKAVAKTQKFRVSESVAESTAYTFNVRLVAVNTAIASLGNPAAGTAAAKVTPVFATESYLIKEFSTRKDLFENKLSVTKKTTKFYSGQRAVVAVPKFSKDIGRIEDIEVGVYNKDGSNAYIDAGYDEDTYEVWVDTYDDEAGSYDVVIYATAEKDNNKLSDDPYSMYRASAKVPITVMKSINYIDVEASTTQIAVLGTKDASVTLKTSGWYEQYDRTKTAKAQTQKFTYELDESTIANPKNAGKVVVKNTKITVKKDFVVGSDPADNQFNVIVRANDYAGNGDYVYKSVPITVTDKVMELGSINIVADGKTYGNGSTIETTALQGATVKVFDKEGNSVDASLVTLTPNKGKVAIDSYGEITVTGLQKSLTIKAVTKDGGKKSATSKYTVKYPEGTSYYLNNVNFGNAVSQQVSDTAYKFTGVGNDTISFYVGVKTGSGDDAIENDYASQAEYNYTVAVKGGKIVYKNTNGGYFRIAPTAAEVTFTVTDKNLKSNNKTLYTFSCTNWQTAAAPKPSTKDKLYVAKYASSDEVDYNYYRGSRISQQLNYTVKFKNASYNAVKFTKDPSSKISISGMEGVYEVIDNSRIETLWVTPYYTGTAKYSVVYGNKINGVFTPMTKATTVSIKVNKTGNVKPVNKYTINPNVAMGVELQAKSAPVQGMVKFNQVVSANVKGKPNQFYKYFEVENGMLQIRSTTRKAEDITAILGLSKDDLTGYLEYQYYNANGNFVTAWEKITVVVNETTIPKYTATDVTIAARDKAEAATTIKVGNVPVGISKVAAASGSGWTATVAEGETGVINLKADAVPVSGKVDLFIIPSASQNTNADALTAGIKVTVKVNVKALEDINSKLAIAKGAKTPDPVINTANNRVDLVVTLTEGKDYTCSLPNEGIKSVAKADASKFTKANDVKAAEAVVSVRKLSAETDEINGIEIVLNRDGLAVNTTYNVPVDLTFDSNQTATVSFSVKTEKKIPTVDEVKTLVGKETFAVSSEAYNDGAKAKTEVLKIAERINQNVIPALSGIQITDAKASDTFKDTTADGETQAGDHKITLTLTDYPKRGAEGAKAEDYTSEMDITVTQAEKTRTIQEALNDVLTNYVVSKPEGDESDTVEIPASMTQYSLQQELQTAVDKAAPDKYFVTVSSFDLETEEAQTRAVVVVSLSFTYTVQDRITQDTPVYYQSVYISVNSRWGDKLEVPEEKPDLPVTPDPTPTISITPDKTNVQAGGTVTFSVEISGTDAAITNDDITWTLQPESHNSNTKIENGTGQDKLSAVLTVAAEEIEKKLTVSASITVDEETYTSDAITITVGEENPDVPDEPETKSVTIQIAEDSKEAVNLTNAKYAYGESADSLEEGNWKALTFADNTNESTVDVPVGEKLFIKGLAAADTSANKVTVKVGNDPITADEESNVYTISDITDETTVVISVEKQDSSESGSESEGN